MITDGYAILFLLKNAAIILLKITSREPYDIPVSSNLTNSDSSIIKQNNFNFFFIPITDGCATQNTHTKLRQALVAQKIVKIFLLFYSSNIN